MAEIQVQKRAYARRQNTCFIEESELQKYRDDGWYLMTEHLPDPEGGPDLEVLELIIQDREAEAREAQKELDAKNNAVKTAYLNLDQAKRLIKAEAEVKSEHRRAVETLKAVEACTKLLTRRKGEAVPARDLVALAENSIQQNAIRNEFCGPTHYVGKDEAGDDLFAFDKQEYLANKRQEEERARKEKEAAIRARMMEAGVR